MKILAVFAGLLTAFFILACDSNPETGNNKKFDYDLQGTWVSNDPGRYSGTLVIDYNRITITGYSEKQTPLGEDDNKRPFRDFTKGIALKGYAEEGKFFIEVGGLLQEGIPYTYWEENPPPDYPGRKFLRFTFGNRSETLENQ